VAGDLVLRRGVRGVTVAEIAEKAHVGKGTVYLYWDTKEDLLVSLFARDFLAVADEYHTALTADPDVCRPHRMVPRMVRTALEHPFVRALQTDDIGLLGVLAEHPRSKELLETLGPNALLDQVLPVWRRHHLARTDWALADQAYALRALTDGFIAAATKTDIPVDSPDHIMAATVLALLGPSEANTADVEATATEGLRLLDEARQVALGLT